MLFSPSDNLMSNTCCGCMFFTFIAPVFVIVILALLGPAIGNVFSNIVTTL